eukprot:TRINITY_DN34841_c0_g5_i1.p1 TRINITY_DN34841_c0_g5~~TRINITY_DN34841_c0_g5_i1.p1  ORF type:complete len:666 (-),score=89.59 TRINITY_DN34841_c0_g5_i1:34-2031(-)
MLAMLPNATGIDASWLLSPWQLAVDPSDAASPGAPADVPLWLDALERLSDSPTQLLGIVWLSCAVAWLLAFACCPASSRHAEIDAQVAAIAKSASQSEELSVEMSRKLQALRCDDLVAQVQVGLNLEVGKFKRFLKILPVEVDKLGGANADVALSRPVALLVHRWLQVLEQCSPDPVAQPYKVMQKAELLSCSTVTAVSRLATQVLSNVSIELFQHPLDVDTASFPAEMGQPSDEKGGKCKPTQWAVQCSWLQCWELNKQFASGCKDKLSGPPSSPLRLGFATVRFLSARHALLLLFFCGGFWLCVALLLVDLGAAVAALLGEAILLTLVLRFESLDIDANQAVVIRQLARRGVQLATELDRVRQQHEAISDVCKRAESLVALWRCRTRPHLAVLRAAHGLFTCTPWESAEEAQDFLDLLARESDRVRSKLGCISLWTARSFSPLRDDPQLLSSEAALFFKDQLERCEAGLQGAGEARAVMANPACFQLLNFVVVRVISCTGLLVDGNGASCFKSGVSVQPYVRLRVAGEDDAWLCTDPLSGGSEPRWHYGGHPAEFHMNATKDPMAPVELEVMDVGRCGCDAVLGRTELQYQAFPPGAWYPLQQPLAGTTATLHIEVYVAVDATNLQGMRPFCPEPPRLAVVANSRLLSPPLVADGMKTAAAAC